MKMTADQLLKLAGITPSTTLRTRLNESVGTARRRTRLQEATSKAELKRLQDEAKSISDKIDNIVEDGGTVSLTDPLSVKLRKVRAQIKKLKSVKEGVEHESDSLEYQFGELGKAFKEHIYTMVDMLMDEEGFDPSTADVEDILNRVAEDIANMATEIATEQAAHRAVMKALGQRAQAYDDEGNMSRQRRLDV